jgi:hypothetical protein
MVSLAVLPREQLCKPGAAAHASYLPAAVPSLQQRLALFRRNESDFAQSSVGDQPLDAIESLQAYFAP